MASRSRWSVVSRSAEVVLIRKASGRCGVSAVFAIAKGARKGTEAEVKGSSGSFLGKVRNVAGDETVETAQHSGATIRIGLSLSILHSKPNWEHFHSGKGEGAIKSIRIEKVQTVLDAEHVLSIDIIDDGCLYVCDHIAGVSGEPLRNCCVRRTVMSTCRYLKG